MSDLVGNPEDWFSHVAALISVYHALYQEKLTCSELINKFSDLFSPETTDIRYHDL